MCVSVCQVGLVFQSVVAGVEVINCQSIKIQVGNNPHFFLLPAHHPQALGGVPTISVDKTDGCQMFLSSEGLGVDIITAKSSEMNVSILIEGQLCHYSVVYKVCLLILK